MPDDESYSSDDIEVEIDDILAIMEKSEPIPLTSKGLSESQDDISDLVDKAPSKSLGPKPSQPV